MNNFSLILKRIVFSLIILLSLASCSNDNDVDEIFEEEVVAMEEPVDVTINGVKHTSSYYGFTTLGTDYIGSTLLTVYQDHVPSISYTFNYKFTKGGALQSFEVEEKSYNNEQHSKKKFKTPTFKPLDSFQISKFEHDEESKKVIIEFSGTLFSSSNSEENRQISGKIITNIDSPVQWGRDYCYIKSNEGTLDLLSFHYQGVKVNGSGDISIDYVTGNGYNIVFKLDQRLANFDIITFNENSITNKVVFRKALPPYLLNASDLGYEFGPDQQLWEEFNTSGKIIVTDVYTGSYQGAGLHVKGEIELIVKNSEGNVLDILELDFVTLN